MARGTALSVLRRMLKAECGLSLQTGVATALDTEINLLLSQIQQWLWAGYQWPFLRRREDAEIVAGTRLYTLPSVVSLDYPVKAEVRYGARWHHVGYGISGVEYTCVDPDADQTRDPVVKWQVYDDEQYEVWPVPTTDQVLRFWGTKALGDLVDSDDTADLDDLLIVLFAAAERQMRAKQVDAKAKLEKANALLARLKAADRPNTMFVMNGDNDLCFSRRPRRVVSVAGNAQGLLLVEDPNVVL